MIVVEMLNMKCPKATCFFVACVLVLERKPTRVVEIADHMLAPITIPRAISTGISPAFNAVNVMIVAPVLVCMIVVITVPISTNHQIGRCAY